MADLTATDCIGPHPVKDLPGMKCREFHNAPRILWNIDKGEFDEAVGRVSSHEGWMRFRDGPHRWFIGADTADAEAVFSIIESRNTTERTKGAQVA